MKGNKVLVMVTGAVLLGALATKAAISAQDKYTLNCQMGSLSQNSGDMKTGKWSLSVRRQTCSKWRSLTPR